jgi:hypothetical protein
MAKVLTAEEEERLDELLAKPKADRTDAEAAETLILGFGMDHIKAAFIVAIERGKSQGDSVELSE